jgi:hypothetical protein
MTNLDVAGMSKKEEFFTAYKKAKAAKSEKQAINSAPVRIDEQIKTFGKTSLGKRDEKALYKDALSV